MIEKSITEQAVDAVEPKPRAKFPTIIDLLAILGVFTLAQLLGMVVAYALGYEVDFSLLQSDDDLLVRATRVAIGRFMFVSYMVVMFTTIIFTLILRRLRGGSGVAVARFSLAGFNPTLLLWGIILLVAISIVMDPLTAYLPEPPELEGRGLMMVLSLVVAAPILEEFLCRGIILEAVRDKWGVLTACIISALFFGVLHFHPTLVVNAFVIGLLLSYLYVRTRSLFAPIVLHSFNNILAFLLIYLGYEKFTLIDIVGTEENYMMVYYPSFALLVISIFMIVRRLSRMDRDSKIVHEQ